MTNYCQPYVFTESREKRVARVQRWRMQLTLVLTLMSLVELTVVCMGYYTEVPFWLCLLCIICVFCNLPLILWLGSLWLDSRKREERIRKQSMNRK